VYEDVEAAADEVAERLQALGGGVPHASLTTLAENATVEPEDGTSTTSARHSRTTSR